MNTSEECSSDPAWECLEGSEKAMCICPECDVPMLYKYLLQGNRVFIEDNCCGFYPYDVLRGWNGIYWRRCLEPEGMVYKFTNSARRSLLARLLRDFPEKCN